jgi:hypothetical protein
VHARGSGAGLPVAAAKLLIAIVVCCNGVRPYKGCSAVLCTTNQYLRRAGIDMMLTAKL